jgi:hypothetical protein
MEQSDWLRVSLNWHASNKSFGGDFKHLDAHLDIEGALPAFFDDC